MMHLPSSALFPIAGGVPTMAVAIGTPIFIALTLVLALCLGVIVAAALPRRAFRGYGPTRWPAGIVSASGAVMRRLAAGGLR